MASGILVPLAGALQASLSVLLVIFYGVIVAQLGWLSQKASKDVSVLCVRLFLPALLVANLGATVTRETFPRYIPVFVWSAVYNFASIAFGVVSTRFLNFPNFVTPALAFNNTTSLPLLLIQCLKSTGVLSSILMDEQDTLDDAVTRSLSYFLINSMIGNSLSFAVGGNLMSAHEEDAPSEDEHNRNTLPPENARDARSGVENSALREESTVYEEGNYTQEAGRPTSGADSPSLEQATEETSLLPTSVSRQAKELQTKQQHYASIISSALPSPILSALSFTSKILNGSFYGMLLGLFIGLVPPLQRACFADQAHGGFLQAWLMNSIKKVGDLFSTLQILTVGVKLSKTVVAAKEGKGEEEAGHVPWGTFLFVEGVRNVLWPLISIPTIFYVATKTSFLSEDPVLWFCMMLAPVGPPALKLLAVADVSGTIEKDKMTISKFLTLSYVSSPIMAFAVAGSLKATQTAMDYR